MMEKLFLRKFRRKSKGKTEQAEDVPEEQVKASMQQWLSLDSQSLVIVMGVTGSGKSSFVNQLKPGAVKVGRSLESGKSQIMRDLCLSTRSKDQKLKIVPSWNSKSALTPLRRLILQVSTTTH